MPVGGDLNQILAGREPHVVLGLTRTGTCALAGRDVVMAMTLAGAHSRDLALAFSGHGRDHTLVRGHVPFAAPGTLSRVRTHTAHTHTHTTHARARTHTHTTFRG